MRSCAYDGEFHPGDVLHTSDTVLVLVKCPTKSGAGKNGRRGRAPQTARTRSQIPPSAQAAR